MNEKLISKLQKLLRLGASSNQHEAELAMQKAMEIAQEHGIELANISTEVQDSSISQENIQFGKRLPIVFDYIYPLITKYFNVKVLFTGNRQFGRGAIFVGSRDNIYTAKYVFDFLADAMDTAWKNYYNSRNIPLSERKSYFWGFYAGLNSKLESQKKQVEEKNNNLALMVVNNEKAIENYLNKTFTNIKTKKTYKNYGHASDSYYDGMDAGRETTIARGNLNN